MFTYAYFLMYLKATSFRSTSHYAKKNLVAVVAEKNCLHQERQHLFRVVGCAKNCCGVKIVPYVHSRSAKNKLKYGTEKFDRRHCQSCLP